MTHRFRTHFLYASLGILALGSMHGCGTNAEVDGAKPGSTESSCADTCAPAPLDWEGPTLLWSGPLWGGTNVPNCPADAPNIIYEGYTDLVATTQCDACKCQPSTGTCSLLTTITLYKTDNACNPGGVEYPFDPPPNWDGSCAAGDSVPSNSINMVTIGPHRLTNDSCTPVEPIPTINGYPPHWNTHALACGVSSKCTDDKTCINRDRPVDEFVTCVYRDGVAGCPKDYPVQHVFYDGFDDQRSCSPCECGAPVGSDCLGMVWLYQDGECKNDLLGMTVGIGQSGTSCSTGPNPGTWPWPIGSMSADPLTYQSGKCATSGGETIGEPVPTGATTFCCREGL